MIETAKWSLLEYHQMIESGLLQNRQVELIYGEIIEMSPEGAPHSSFCSEVSEYLRRVLGNLAKVREAHPITLSDKSEPEQDLYLWRSSHICWKLQQINRVNDSKNLSVPNISYVCWLILFCRCDICKIELSWICSSVFMRYVLQSS